MTTITDTTGAASRHDGGALPGDAVDAGLDEAAARLLQDFEADQTDRTPTLVLTAPELDPTYRIGAQIGRLVALHSSLDCAGRQEDHEAEGRRDRHMARISDSADLLREAITYQQATSLQGALAQIVALSQALSDITDDEGVDREERVDTARRCLFSIARVLSVSAGTSPRVFGADYHMPQHFDRLGNAWSGPEASYVVDGPKPTIDVDPPCGTW